MHAHGGDACPEDVYANGSSLHADGYANDFLRRVHRAGVHGDHQCGCERVHGSLPDVHAHENGTR